MEKKIERVPYISKWYKWKEDCSGEHFRLDVERTNQYLKDELLHFAFDEQNAGSDWNVDKIYIDWLHKDTTTISCPNSINFWSSQKPQLKYVCNLTQWDIDDLKTRLQLAMQHNSLIIDGKYNNGNIIKKDDINRIIKLVNTRMQDVIDYLDNNNDIREKCQKDQLERLEKQSKPQKSYEGTLGQHWKELMDLFEIKEKCGIEFIKGYINETYYYSSTLDSIKEKLGLDFIKDFIKACEKCED